MRIKELRRNLTRFIYPLTIGLGLTIIAVLGVYGYQGQRKELALKKQVAEGGQRETSLSRELAQAKTDLNSCQNEDQRLINQGLNEELANIKKTYQKAAGLYEKLLDLKPANQKINKLDELFAAGLALLSQTKYASAEATLANLDKKIEEENQKAAAAFTIPANVPAVNQPPGAGYRRQQVAVGSANFLVDIITADLNSTRVIVDTASDSDCADNCAVLALADYVARSGAFAGVNGSYFCPATYPACASKKNSFDTLLMNKNKRYFNSDNNVYSTVPAAIFSGNSARFVTQSLEWGRDTGVDAVIANHPLLVLNSQIFFSGAGDQKQASKGNRSFLGNTGNTVYIGVVHSATVAESARVLQALGINQALNLDDGGSTALWSGGYKVGPGRQIPNAVLLVRK
jgi:hypothetical protein